MILLIILTTHFLSHLRTLGQAYLYLASDGALKVMQELLMQGSSMAGWRRLLKLGVKYGTNGKPTADLLEVIRTWTTVTTKTFLESQQYLGVTSEKGSKEKPLALEWFERASGASTQ